MHAEPKYKQPFEFIPSHTCVLFTNFLPKVGSSDAGTWSRLVVVPCRAKFRNEAGESRTWPGTCSTTQAARCCPGSSRARAGSLRRIQAGPAACVREAVEEYKADNDWLAHFLEDCCEIGKDYSEKSALFWRLIASGAHAWVSFPEDKTSSRPLWRAWAFAGRKQNRAISTVVLKLLPEWF